jgi:hypothetical protein
VQPSPSDFMPIFMVVPGVKTVAASHPTDPGKGGVPATSPTKDREDAFVRIGTMTRNRDDSWSIALMAMPLAGPLIARPPRDGETPSLP